MATLDHSSAPDPAWLVFKSETGQWLLLMLISVSRNFKQTCALKGKHMKPESLHVLDKPLPCRYYKLLDDATQPMAIS